MARPSLKAEFFVRPDGVIIPKAPPLKDSEKWAIYDRDGQNDGDNLRVFCMSCNTAKEAD